VIRLNQYLANCGLCSRRKADALIAAGSVTIDGRPAKVGESVDPSRHRVFVSGRRVQQPAGGPQTIVLNKPAGVVTTLRDERGRKSVASLLPSTPRYFPIGRLDAESTGVLLCTTDGDLAHILTHPSFGVEKLYRVRVSGNVTPETKAALQALRVRKNPDSTITFDIVLREGRNRQVRRMCAQRGLRVLDLTRLKFGPVEIGRLEPGKTRALTLTEKNALERLRPAQKRAPVRPTE